MAATIWFCLVLVICLGMYVVLDGYDLGVGMLTLTERDVKTRRQLIEVVATAWDGNETWLILFGVTLFGGPTDRLWRRTARAVCADRRDAAGAGVPRRGNREGVQHRRRAPRVGLGVRRGIAGCGVRTRCNDRRGT